MKERKEKERRRKEREYIIYNYEKIKKDLSEEDLSEIDMEKSPSTQIDMLQRKMQLIMEKNKKEIRGTNKYNNKGEDWLNKKILKMIRRKDKLLYKIRKERSNDKKKGMIKKVKIKAKEIKKEIEEARNKYFKTKLKDCEGNSKKEWSIINDLLGKKIIRKEVTK